MKKKMVLGLVMALCITAMTGCGVKQKKDTVTVEAGTALVLDATELFNLNKSKAKKVTFNTSDVDMEKVGEYMATATYKKKTYDIKVVVEDTTAPVVEFRTRYMVADDVAKVDPQSIVGNVKEYSGYTLEVTGNEKLGERAEFDDAKLKELEAAIVIPGDQTALAALEGGMPAGDGVYRVAFSFKDGYDNVIYEEVLLAIGSTKTEPDNATASVDTPKNDGGSKNSGGNASGGNTSGGSTSSGGGSGRKSDDTDEVTEPTDIQTENDRKIQKHLQDVVNAGYYNIVPNSVGGGQRDGSWWRV